MGICVIVIGFANYTKEIIQNPQFSPVPTPFPIAPSVPTGGGLCLCAEVGRNCPTDLPVPLRRMSPDRRPKQGESVNWKASWKGHQGRDEEMRHFCTIHCSPLSPSKNLSSLFWKFSKKIFPRSGTKQWRDGTALQFCNSPQQFPRYHSPISRMILRSAVRCQNGKQIRIVRACSAHFCAVFGRCAHAVRGKDTEQVRKDKIAVFSRFMIWIDKDIIRYREKRKNSRFWRL